MIAFPASKFAMNIASSSVVIWSPSRPLKRKFSFRMSLSVARFAAVFSYTIFLYCICSAFLPGSGVARGPDAFPATGGIIGGGCCGSSPTSSSSSSSSWSSSLT